MAILVALAVVAGTAGWWLWPELASAWQPALERAAPASAEASVGVPDLAPEPQGQPPAAAAKPSPARAPTFSELPALPPVHASLADSMTALLARAMAGDGTAACHLKVAADRCRSLQGTMAHAQAMEAVLVEGSFDAGEAVGVGMIASMQVAAEGSNTLCEGMHPNALPTGIGMLERTLASLSPRQKTVIAMLRADGSLARVVRQSRPGGGGFGVDSDDLVPQFLADNDMAFLQAGFDAADPLALEGLLLVHAPGGMIGGMPFAVMRQSRPDPYRFARYARLGLDLFGPDWLGERATRVLDQVLATMPPADRARLDAELAPDVARWRAAEQAHGARVPPENDADALELCRG